MQFVRWKLFSNPFGAGSNAAPPAPTNTDTPKPAPANDVPTEQK